MKKKPDLSGFQQRPALVKDPGAFLDDAVADRAEKQPASDAPAGKKPAPKVEVVPVTQKIFRLRTDVASALKMHAAERSRDEGRRVSEQEIVEQLLCEHLNLSR